jgi:hypothetical protein
MLAGIKLVEERRGVQPEDVCPVTRVLKESHLEAKKEKKRRRGSKISTSERTTIKEEKKLFSVVLKFILDHEKCREDGWRRSDVHLFTEEGR